MKKSFILLLITINLFSQNNIKSPYWELEKTFNFPNKSKNQLFILAEKFVNYGWQSSKFHETTIDELVSGGSPEYDYNNAIQSKNKESGEINIHITSGFETRFHSPFVKSIWFEYNIMISVNNKGIITIKIYDLKVDEFASSEQKNSGLYKNQLRGLERELEDIPNILNKFILKN